MTCHLLSAWTLAGEEGGGTIMGKRERERESDVGWGRELPPSALARAEGSEEGGAARSKDVGGARAGNGGGRERRHHLYHTKRWRRGS